MTDSFDIDVQLRAVGENTIEGTIAPFDETIRTHFGEERFQRGAFAGVDPAKVIMLWQHDRTDPIGRMTSLTEHDDGAVAQFKVSDTTRGRDVMQYARDGVITGLSVGFIPIESTQDGDLRTHTKVSLREVSAVTFPAYESATITKVRSEEEPMDTTTEATDVVDQPTETRNVDYDAEIRELRTQIAAIQAVPEPRKHFETRTLIGGMLANLLDIDIEDRALADVVGDLGTADASGLVYDEYRPEVLSYLDARRYMFTQAGTATFPSSGYGIVYPRRTQSTLVAERTGEKAQAATRALQVVQETHSMKFFAGAVDVALELISQGDPSVLSVVAADLMDAYAVATEASFVADTEAAAFVGGATLDTSTYGAFIGDVIGTSELIRSKTGMPGNKLGMVTASWKNLLGLLDGEGRRVLATSGGTNADGSASFVAEAVNVGGIDCFHSPNSTADVQFNQKALRKAEKPPLEVSSTNVALMGRDLGVIGATIVLPLYPEGIIKYTATAAAAKK